MENSFIFVISEGQIIARSSPLLLNHRGIVRHDSVVQGQISLVVGSIRSGSYLVNDLQFLLNADDMLDRLSLVVLLSPRNIKFVIASVPVENSFITIASANEKRVFSL